MSAAERAAEVVWAEQKAGRKNGHAWAAIKALMADPDLLVDLAIEAGGLMRQQWEWIDTEEHRWMTGRTSAGSWPTLTPNASTP